MIQNGSSKSFKTCRTAKHIKTPKMRELHNHIYTLPTYIYFNMYTTSPKVSSPKAGAFSWLRLPIFISLSNLLPHHAEESHNCAARFSVVSLPPLLSSSQTDSALSIHCLRVSKYTKNMHCDESGWQLPQGGLVRGHDKPIHDTCAIYFPSGIYIYVWVHGFLCRESETR